MPTCQFSLGIFYWLQWVTCVGVVNMGIRAQFSYPISALFIILSISYVSANLVHKKFEYKYSFKPPYLAQKDGSVPFWEYGGSKLKYLLHVGCSGCIIDILLILRLCSTHRISYGKRYKCDQKNVTCLTRI